MKKKDLYLPSRRQKIIRFIFILFFIGIIFISVSMLSVVLLIPSIDTVRGENIILGAHRGNSIEYTENTLEAFESAVQEDKYKFIEFDVQYTEDKVPVIYHDQKLLRLQKLNYNVKDITYEEFLNFSRYHIPTYWEVMDIVAGKKPLMIEIKSHGNITEDRELLEFLNKDLEERKLLNTSMILSVSKEVAIESKRINPEMKTGKGYYVAESTFVGSEYLTGKLFEDFEESKADYLAIHGSNLRNYETLKNLLPEGKVLLIWYLSDELYILEDKIGFAEGISSLKPRLKNLFLEIIGKKPEPCIWWCE